MTLGKAYADSNIKDTLRRKLAIFGARERLACSEGKEQSVNEDARPTQKD